MSATSAPRRLVYTALMGGYEELNEQPISARSDVPFVCFTDSPHLSSNTWKVERVEPAMPSDPIRSARRVKLLGHPMLDDYDETLWIDNSVVLRARPETVLDAWLDGVDLATVLHSYRAKVLDEFDAVVQAGFDDTARVFEQVRHYLVERPHVLDAPPLWTALLARRHTPEVAAMGERWFTDVLRYSRRDQLSVVAALDRSPDLRWRGVELDNFSSELHTWPVAARRDRSRQGRNPLEAMKPLELRIRDLERREDERVAELDRLATRLEASEEQSANLLAAIAHREEEMFRLIDEADAARTEATEARGRANEIMASRAWKLSRVLSRVAAPLASRSRASE